MCRDMEHHKWCRQRCRAREELSGGCGGCVAPQHHGWGPLSPKANRHRFGPLVDLAVPSVAQFQAQK